MQMVIQLHVLEGTFRTTSQDNFADKGEGIYKVTNANYAAAKGKILNGGGGGNSHNAGGGREVPTIPLEV